MRTSDVEAALPSKSQSFFEKNPPRAVHPSSVLDTIAKRS